MTTTTVYDAVGGAYGLLKLAPWHVRCLRYFEWSTKRLAQNPDSPDTVAEGLGLPQWSWDGPVE